MFFSVLLYLDAWAIQRLWRSWAMLRRFISLKYHAVMALIWNSGSHLKMLIERKFSHRHTQHLNPYYLPGGIKCSVRCYKTWVTFLTLLGRLLPLSMTQNTFNHLDPRICSGNERSTWRFKLYNFFNLLTFLWRNLHYLFCVKPITRILIFPKPGMESVLTSN